MIAGARFAHQAANNELTVVLAGLAAGWSWCNCTRLPSGGS
jgi:hypothetical protein